MSIMIMMINIQLLTNTFDFQFYIITGGLFANGSLASTEILKKEGGTSWQTAASLPSSRSVLRGVSLPNGHFMVSGDGGWLFLVQYLPFYCIS